jgi:hypothetical protein
MIKTLFLKKLSFLFIIFFIDYFDMLILKINFFKKYYLYKYLNKKNTLQDNNYQNTKQTHKNNSTA